MNTRRKNKAKTPKKIPTLEEEPALRRSLHFHLSSQAKNPTIVLNNSNTFKKKARKINFNQLCMEPIYTQTQIHKLSLLRVHNASSPTAPFCGKFLKHASQNFSHSIPFSCKILSLLVKLTDKRDTQHPIRHFHRCRFAFLTTTTGCM